jgi:hypothetical protein
LADQRAASRAIFGRPVRVDVRRLAPKPVCLRQKAVPRVRLPDVDEQQRHARRGVHPRVFSHDAEAEDRARHIHKENTALAEALRPLATFSLAEHDVWACQDVQHRMQRCLFAKPAALQRVVDLAIRSGRPCLGKRFHISRVVVRVSFQVGSACKAQLAVCRREAVLAELQLDELLVSTIASFSALDDGQAVDRRCVDRVGDTALQAA